MHIFAATAWDVIAGHAAAFGIGVIVGLGAASRYRIVDRKRSDNGTDQK